MQNYRNNGIPYMNYKTMPKQVHVVRRDSWSDKVLAMAYVPWQTWKDLFDAEKAFQCGTIFCELNKPFLGRGGVNR